MQLFCKVVNDEVVAGPISLPAGFDQAGHGFIPAVVTKPETFDDASEAWEAPEYDINEDLVYVTYTKRAKTQAELDDYQDMKDQQAAAEAANAVTMTQNLVNLLTNNQLTQAQKDSISALL